jgi:hypothetical protein
MALSGAHVWKGLQTLDYQSFDEVHLAPSFCCLPFASSALSRLYFLLTLFPTAEHSGPTLKRSYLHNVYVVFPQKLLKYKTS